MAELVKIEIVLQYRNMGMRGFFFAQLLGTVNVKNFNMKMRELKKAFIRFFSQTSCLNHSSYRYRQCPL